MKKIFLLLLCFFPLLCFAQGNKISNVLFSKQNDVVIIKYFLNVSRFDNVKVLMTDNIRIRELTYVSGDVGTVYGQGLKTVKFDIKKELGVDTLNDDVFFTVIGTDKPKAVREKDPNPIKKQEYNDFHMSFEYLYTPGAAMGFGIAAFAKWGGYVHARYTTIGTVFSRSEGYSLDVTGHGYFRNAYTAGVVRKLHRNIFIYGGLGYGEYARVLKGNEVSEYGFAYSEDYYWDKPVVKGLEIEGGLMFNLYGCFLSVGYSSQTKVSSPFFSNFSMGIGYILTL